MNKKIYSFEVIGQNNKRIGSTPDDILTKKEMMFKARAILQGANVLRSYVVVRVRERETNEVVFEIKS